MKVLMISEVEIDLPFCRSNGCGKEIYHIVQRLPFSNDMIFGLCDEHYLEIIEGNKGNGMRFGNIPIIQGPVIGIKLVEATPEQILSLIKDRQQGE